jgi:hypothetical protein
MIGKFFFFCRNTWITRKEGSDFERKDTYSIMAFQFHWSARIQRAIESIFREKFDAAMSNGVELPPEVASPMTLVEFNVGHIV